MLQIQNISKLGIGGWGLGGLAQHDPKNNDEKQLDALVYTLQKGLNFAEINFWNSEGHSVTLISEAIKRSGKKREDIFLVLAIYDYNNPTLSDVEKEIEKFFITFETDSIDSLEFPLSAFYKYGFENLVELVEKYLSQNKIRYTSITNSNLETLKKYHEIFKDKLFSHEVHFSFEIRENEKLGIMQYALEHGIKNVIFQPLRRNRTAKHNWPILIELAEKYGKTQNQILLNWIVQKGFLPLVKSETKEHIDENFAALEFSLQTEDVEKLNTFSVPNYKEPEIDWYLEGKGTSIFMLPNTFDDKYPVIT